MITKIKLWLYGIGAAIFTTVAALLYRKGRKDVEAEHTRRRLDAMKEKQNVQREIETQDDQRLIDLISNRD
jgi:membrane protein implicated in regulation of membrane protease activity